MFVVCESTVLLWLSCILLVMICMYEASSCTYVVMLAVLWGGVCGAMKGKGRENIIQTPARAHVVCTSVLSRLTLLLGTFL